MNNHIETYPIWSPTEAYEAANMLLALLEQDEKRYWEKLNLASQPIDPEIRKCE